MFVVGTFILAWLVHAVPKILLLNKKPLNKRKGVAPPFAAAEDLPAHLLAMRLYWRGH